MTDECLPAKLAQYIRNSNIALAMSDTSTDAPLILVNAAFCKLTGYEEDEVVGQNCRFLQGPETKDDMRQPMHDFVHGHGEDSGRFPIVNYRKDGMPFHNYVFMTRLRDHHGEVQYILASQFDMSSATQRAKVRSNDAKLGQALSDVEQIGREFGLAMIGSAEILAASVATMAKLNLLEQ